jgi:glycosyltransferase involved in cell wall biosynthesis
MISVIIPTLNAAAELPRCFDSLISAVVRGTVREVIVADGGSDDETRVIADATGAHIVRAAHGRAAQFMAGAKAAKSDWLLLLHPETALETGWDVEADAFMSRATLENPRAAYFRYAIEAFGASARRKEMAAAMRCTLFGLPSGEQALLIPKRLYLKLGGHRAGRREDLDLLRRIGRGRLALLRSRAINKPRSEDSARAASLLQALRLPHAVLSRLSN